MATLDEQKKLVIPYMQARCSGGYAGKDGQLARALGLERSLSAGRDVSADLLPCCALPCIATPVLQRAQEVEKAEPKIAYYCRMYALEQASWWVRGFEHDHLP